MGGAVALVTGDDFYSVVLPESHAAVDGWVGTVHLKQWPTYE
jgi:hypothetical protein